MGCRTATGDGGGRRPPKSSAPSARPPPLLLHPTPPPTPPCPPPHHCHSHPTPSRRVRFIGKETFKVDQHLEYLSEANPKTLAERVSAMQKEPLVELVREGGKDIKVQRQHPIWRVRGGVLAQCASARGVPPRPSSTQRAPSPEHAFTRPPPPTHTPQALRRSSSGHPAPPKTPVPPHSHPPPTPRQLPQAPPPPSFQPQDSGFAGSAKFDTIGMGVLLGSKEMQSEKVLRVRGPNLSQLDTSPDHPHPEPAANATAPCSEPRGGQEAEVPPYGFPASSFSYTRPHPGWLGGAQGGGLLR